MSGDFRNSYLAQTKIFHPFRRISIAVALPLFFLVDNLLETALLDIYYIV